MFGAALSVAAVVERWSENVVWQFFCGMEYYVPSPHGLPATRAVTGRRRIIER